MLVAMGRELKAIVRAAGKRQVDVAMESGIGLRTVAGYMAGADIPLSALLRIAPVVRMEPEALTERLTVAGRKAAAKSPLGTQSGEEMPPPLPEDVRRAVLDREVLGDTRPDRVVTDGKSGRSA